MGQEIVVASQSGGSLQFSIDGWLHEKFNRSGSGRTKQVYESTMKSFRDELAVYGYDLDSDAQKVSIVLRTWAAKSWHPLHKGKVSSATQANRIAVISSYYKYAFRLEHLSGKNPLTYVDRAPTSHPNKARPLAIEDVRRGLDQIDRDTPVGRRDYALLVLAFATGMRITTLASLTMECLKVKNGVVTISTTTKGGKEFYRELSADESQVLADYLLKTYEASNLRALIATRPGAPLWVSFGVNNFMRPLGNAGLRAALRRYFGTTKFHTTRHTFAKAELASGASLADLQGVLGHKNIAITAHYVESQSGEVNPYASKLDELLGIKSKESN